jgi:translation initiation factor IF-3
MATAPSFFCLNEVEDRITKQPHTRVNHAIRSPQVRLVSQTGNMLGVKTIQEALKLADETGYDLIEIAPGAVPPVCKLGNFSKFLYEKEKKLKEQRKNKGGGGQVKEIRIRPKIGEHDLMVKINATINFLKERHKVRISFIFMGREMEHRDIALRMIDKIAESIAGVGVIETRPQMYGNRMIIILVPEKG